MRPNNLLRAAAVVAAGIVVALGLSGTAPASEGTDGRHSVRISPPPLLDGDLVFRRGRDLVSRIVLTQSDASRFSHVGIVVLEHGVPYVIHALPAEGGDPGGVRREPLATFAATANASEFAVYRMAGLTGQERSRVRETALRMQGRPFDTEFRLSDESALYCTETVLDAYASIGKILVPKGAGVLAPMLQEPAVPPDLVVQSGRIKQIYSLTLTP